MSKDRVAVVGGGAWGTALAIHCAGLGQSVGLWIREPDVAQQVREHRDNPVFLPGIHVPREVTPHSDLRKAVDGADLVIFVVPSAFCRAVYRELSTAIGRDVPVVVATKGLETDSLALPLDVARAEAGRQRPLAVLSGPSFAREVAQGKPTALVIASHDADLTRHVQHEISTDSLRLYSNSDPLGVQLAGALKNVIAISAGVAASLDMGSNALAALITRGLAEISRLGTCLGGSAATFSGLAGLGDLVLTCTGGLSRNRQVGLRLGRGERLSEILESMHSVAEGVGTTRSARALGLREGVEMPVVEEMHQILFEQASPERALQRLMGRPLTSEDRAAP